MRDLVDMVAEQRPRPRGRFGDCPSPDGRYDEARRLIDDAEDGTPGSRVLARRLLEQTEGARHSAERLVLVGRFNNLD